MIASDLDPFDDPALADAFHAWRTSAPALHDQLVARIIGRAVEGGVQAGDDFGSFCAAVRCGSSHLTV